MHLIDQRIFGIAILFLLGVLVVIKQRTTGSILDQPKGNLLIQVVNIFNLFFLLVVNPLVAILLITGDLEAADPTRIVVDLPLFLMQVEFIGLVLYFLGYLIMAWALISLGRNYQLGGSTPREADKIVVDGPYKFIRHPMYVAALCISLGLACLTQSLACLAVFSIYIVLLILLIPLEEEGLRRVYGQQYTAYQQKTRRLVPFVF